MVAGSLALMAQYAWWRITDTLPAPACTFEYALALVFLGAELVGIVTAALSLAVPYSDAGSIPRRRRERRMAFCATPTAFDRRAHLLVQ